MFKGAYCIVATEHQAEAVVEQLKNSGFSNRNISVLFPEKHETRDSTHRMILVHSSRPEEIQKARRIFEAAGAQDIAYTEDAGGMEAAPRHMKAS